MSLEQSKINIAIDGHSSCGKSTTAKGVAKALGYIYIDTGAMYRAITLYFLRNNIVELDEVESFEDILTNIKIDIETFDGQMYVLLNDEKVDKDIRSMEVSNFVSPVSEISAVRGFLVRQQQQIAGRKGVVMDGRDIGTVVIPDAELKIFMTADADVRAKRRFDELIKKGEVVDYESIKKNLLDRDRIDSTRKDSPLTQADDAILIDTSRMNIQQQINEIIELSKPLIVNK